MMTKDEIQTRLAGLLNFCLHFAGSSVAGTVPCPAVAVQHVIDLKKALEEEPKAASAAPAIRELHMDCWRERDGSVKYPPTWLFASWSKGCAPHVCVGDKPVYIPAGGLTQRAVGFNGGKVLVRTHENKNQSSTCLETPGVYEFAQLQPVLVPPMPMEGELILAWNAADGLADIRYAFNNEENTDDRGIRTYQSAVSVKGQRSEYYKNWYPFCSQRCSQPPMFWDAVTEWPAEGLCFVSGETELQPKKRG